MAAAMQPRTTGEARATQACDKGGGSYVRWASCSEHKHSPLATETWAHAAGVPEHTNGRASVRARVPPRRLASACDASGADPCARLREELHSHGVESAPPRGCAVLVAVALAPARRTDALRARGATAWRARHEVELALGRGARLQPLLALERRQRHRAALQLVRPRGKDWRRRPAAGSGRCLRRRHAVVRRYSHVREDVDLV